MINLMQIQTSHNKISIVSKSLAFCECLLRVAFLLLLIGDAEIIYILELTLVVSCVKQVVDIDGIDISRKLIKLFCLRGSRLTKGSLRVLGL